MTSWTSRIDALLAEKPDTAMTMRDFVHAQHDWLAFLAFRLALAAERLKEPHGRECFRGVSLAQAISHNPDEPVRWVASGCACGKDSDLLRILEGR